jgi:hypothetical protein
MLSHGAQVRSFASASLVVAICFIFFYFVVHVIVLTLLFRIPILLR